MDVKSFFDSIVEHRRLWVNAYGSETGFYQWYLSQLRCLLNEKNKEVNNRWA